MTGSSFGAVYPKEIKTSFDFNTTLVLPVAAAKPQMIGNRETTSPDSCCEGSRFTGRAGNGASTLYFRKLARIT